MQLDAARRSSMQLVSQTWKETNMQLPVKQWITHQPLSLVDLACDDEASATHVLGHSSSDLIEIAHRTFSNHRSNIGPCNPYTVKK